MVSSLPWHIWYSTRHHVFSNRATTKHIDISELIVTWLNATRYASEYHHTKNGLLNSWRPIYLWKILTSLSSAAYRTKIMMSLFGYGNAPSSSDSHTQQPQDLNARRLRRENRRRSSELRQSDEQSAPAPTKAGPSTPKRSDTPTLRKEDPPASHNLTREHIQKWR